MSTTRAAEPSRARQALGVLTGPLWSVVALGLGALVHRYLMPETVWPLVVGALVAVGRWPGVWRALWGLLTVSRVLSVALLTLVAVWLLRAPEHGLWEDWPQRGEWGEFAKGVGLWFGLAWLVSRGWFWRALFGAGGRRRG